MTDNAELEALLPDDLVKRHRRICDLQERVTQDAVRERYATGQVDSLPETGQSAGFPLPIAEGWEIEHTYSSPRRDVFVASCKEGARLDNHRHEQEEIIFMVEGTMNVIVEGQGFQVRQGQMFQVGADQQHACEPLTACTMFVQFEPPIVDSQDTATPQSLSSS